MKSNPYTVVYEPQIEYALNEIAFYYAQQDEMALAEKMLTTLLCKSINCTLCLFTILPRIFQMKSEKWLSKHRLIWFITPLWIQKYATRTDSYCKRPRA